MTDILSFALAALVIVGLFWFGLTMAYDLVIRLRDRLLPPAVQLERAGLGKYPHWRD